MEKIAVIYFEGNDCKVSVFERDKDLIKLVKAESISSSMNLVERPAQPGILVVNSQLEMVSYETISDETAFSNSFVQSLSKFFEEMDVRNIKVIPVITEPALYFNKIEEEKDLANLKATLNGKAKEQPISIVEMAGKSKLAVYSSGKSNYLQVLDSLARTNKSKYLKIVSVKCAEISLADYVAEKEKFLDNESSLVIYVGKDYTKLIFMRGRRIAHLGSTVNVARNSSNPYYVINSKIMFEMENMPTHSLEKIVICGEDSSETLLNTLIQSYPEAKVSHLNITEYKIPGNNYFGYKMPAYSVNIAVMEEYLKEIKKKRKGINLLPSYYTEQLKSFGWESYLLMLIIFAVVFGFTTLILRNEFNLTKIKGEIVVMEKVREQNQELSDRITQQKEKISNFSKSKVILDQYSQNTGTLSAAMKKISDYAADKGNIWFTNLKLDNSRSIKLNGYALGRHVLTTLSYSYKDALLSTITYDPLRDYKSYKFEITTSLNNAGVKK